MAGMVRREAALFCVAVEDGREVEHLPHCVAYEVRHVPRRHERVQRGPQQPTLISVPGAKHFGHETSESSLSLTVETLIRAGS